jgi:Xaa-Pro dipeptidase
MRQRDRHLISARASRLRTAALAAVVALCAAPLVAPAQPAGKPTPRDPDIRSRFDLAAVQGILAVQRLDGWLLYDLGGQNPVAAELVNPDGLQTRRWFYFIPARGQPVALVHKVEASNFDRVPGRKIEYAGYRELERGLRELLKGSRTVAMEYTEKAAIPTLSRVDAGTIELVRSQGVTIRSSAELVQFSKSLWGPQGREAHYIAAHHLSALRAEALAFIAERVRAGRAVTEYDVQQLIVRGYQVRGLAGPPPIVAADANSADPHYRPTAARNSPIKRGSLVLIDMWARVEGAERPIFADITWMAYVGDKVPARYAEIFAVVADARDQALALIRDRVDRRRAIRGYEVDQRARAVIGRAGHADKFVHRTGHSLDTSVHGDGANLDDFETRETRNLVMGAGFTIEPGIYLRGEFGVRSEIDVYIGPGGVEVTTPIQTEITPILATP